MPSLVAKVLGTRPLGSQEATVQKARVSNEIEDRAESTKDWFLSEGLEGI
jgi:hypothetical protein